MRLDYRIDYIIVVVFNSFKNRLQRLVLRMFNDEIREVRININFRKSKQKITYSVLGIFP